MSGRAGPENVLNTLDYNAWTSLCSVYTLWPQTKSFLSSPPTQSTSEYYFLLKIDVVSSQIAKGLKRTLYCLMSTIPWPPKYGQVG